MKTYFLSPREDHEVNFRQVAEKIRACWHVEVVGFNPTQLRFRAMPAEALQIGKANEADCHLEEDKWCEPAVEEVDAW